MRAHVAIGAIAAAMAMAIAGCGGSEPEKEEPPMRMEDTAFGPLVTTPDKVQDRANEAVELRRENIEERLEEDEGP